MTGHRRVQLVSLVSANVVTIASNAAAALLTTLLLGAEQRGVVVLGLTISGVAAVLGGLGTSTAFRFQLPQCQGTAARAALVRAYTWCLVGSVVIAAAIAVGASLVSAPLITPELATPGMLAATGATAAAQVAFLQITDAWYADGHFRRGSTGAAAMSLAALLCSVATLLPTRSPALFLLAHAAGSAVAGAVQLVTLRRAGLLALVGPVRAAVGGLVARGIPTLGSAVGLLVALRADRYVLGAFAGTAAVGVYSLAATLTEFGRLLPSAVGQLFLRDASRGEGRARWGGAVRLACLTAAGSALLIAPAGWLLIVPVFGAEFAGARHLLLVLTVAELCFAPYVVASRGLLGGGWNRTAGLVGLVGIVTAVSAYSLATAVAGATGTAIGSVLVYLVLSLLTWHLLRNRLAAADRTRPRRLLAAENNTPN